MIAIKPSLGEGLTNDGPYLEHEDFDGSVVCGVGTSWLQLHVLVWNSPQEPDHVAFGLQGRRHMLGDIYEVSRRYYNCLFVLMFD